MDGLGPRTMTRAPQGEQTRAAWAHEPRLPKLPTGSPQVGSMGDDQVFEIEPGGGIEELHDAPESSAATNKKLVLGIVVGLTIVCLVLGLVLGLVVLDDDDDSTSTSSSSPSSSVTPTPTVSVSASGSASAASGVTVTVLPDSGTSGGRRWFRRLYSDDDTDYTGLTTAKTVNTPGSEILDQVNMIACFVQSTGLYVVQTSSAPYYALVDMSNCEAGQRGADKKIYEVAVFETTADTAASPAIYTGKIAFQLQGAELKAEANMQVYTVGPTETCPGMKIEETSLKKTCWVGTMQWIRGGGSSQMNGYFECTYDGTSGFPVSIAYYETDLSRSPTQTDSMKLATTSDGTSVRTLLGRQASSSTYYCLNSNQNFARVSKNTSSTYACAPNSTGGRCLSRSNKTNYPLTLLPFHQTTGTLATASGTVSLSLEYTKNSKRCYAGVSGDGGYMSCGQGQPSESDMISNGGTATDQAGSSYTLHHSSKIQKFVVVEMALAEFAGAYHISYWQQDNTFSPSRFYQYILAANASDSNTTMAVAYKRYYNSSTWTAFVAGTAGENITLAAGDLNFAPCWQQSRYYTGADAPPTGEWWGKFFVQTNSEYTYDTAAGMVYLAKSNGLIQVGSADVDMICPLFCKRQNGGSCQEFTHCPKQSFSGITPSNTCTKGNSCTYYPYSTDAGYKYTFSVSDAQLYTYTDNSKNPISATAIDGRSGVTYTSSNQWGETTESYMYPGSDTTLFDTELEVAAHKKVAGNVYYKVGIGMLGGYSGWSFYAKNASSQFVQLVDPISCTLTMSTAFDANAGSQYNGAKFELTFYGQYTSGLSWEQLTFGDAEVGTRQSYVPAPQIGNGATCVGPNETYRLKSEATMVVLNQASNPTTDCAAFDIMVNPGSLPTSTDANNHIPSHNSTTTPTPTRTCIDQQSLTHNAGCAYYPNVTSTKG